MVIGLTGSFGAGKGAVVNYLVKEKKFLHYSARDLIKEEIEKRELLLNRDSMIIVGNSIREGYGPSYIIETLFNRAKTAGGNVVIESLRAVAEVRYIQESGGIVLAIDSDPVVRYERAVARSSETDDVSFEKWQEQEKLESNTEDETKQNIFGAIALSDYVLDNDGTLEELYARIDEVLKKIDC